MTLFRRALTTISVCLALYGVGRTHQEAFGDIRLYEGVLDQLFPRIPHLEGHLNKGTIIARFSSSLIHEMQIQVNDVDAAYPKLTVWRVPEGSPSVWEQTAHITQHSGSHDPKRIASAIHVEKLTIPNSGREIADLMRKFSELRFSPGLDEGMVLDGVAYDLWFYSISNDTHFSLQGSRVGTASDHPLVLWMLSLRSAVTHLPQWSAAKPGSDTQVASPGQSRTERPVAGNLYVNDDYQYEVRLPAGVKAYTSVPPNPDHGFEIRIAGTGTQLWVDASYDAVGWGSSEAVIADRIAAAKELCGHIPALKQTTGKLDGRGATEYTLNCSGKFEAEIAAVRPMGIDEAPIIYEIGLKGEKADDARANQLFQGLKTGFRQMSK